MSRHQFCLMLFVASVSGFLGGAITDLLYQHETALAQSEEATEALPPQTEPAGSDIVEELKVRRLVLLDAAGTVRAEFGLDKDDSPHINFLTQEGKVILEMGLAMEDTENPYLIFLDSHERERVLVSVHEDKDPEVFLFDESGNLAWGAP